jgi:predicted dehydrogenase
MSSRPFRVGLIGTGGIAQAMHIPGWKALPEVEIVAVADVSESSARQAAEQAGGAKVFTDYRELLRLDLDAVDICTPNRVHTPAVLAALGSGRHVLCEKPLAVSTREIRKMGELADRRKLVLMTAQHQRFTGSGSALKGWADAGNLGEVYHARVRAMRRAWLPVRAGFIDRELSGGGPCMDIGVHALDLCLWLMGFPKPVRVSGVSRVNFAQGNAIPGMWGEWDRKRFSVEDFAAGFVHFDNGATMTLEASWLGHQAENEDMSCQLFGTKAGVKWPSAEFATVSGGAFVQGTVTHPRPPERAHHAEIAAFHRAVLAGGPSPVPWTESIRVIAILEAVYASQSKRREIILK